MAHKVTEGAVPYGLGTFSASTPADAHAFCASHPLASLETLGCRGHDGVGAFFAGEFGRGD